MRYTQQLLHSTNCLVNNLHVTTKFHISEYFLIAKIKISIIQDLDIDSCCGYDWCLGYQNLITKLQHKTLFLMLCLLCRLQSLYCKTSGCVFANCCKFNLIRVFFFFFFFLIYFHFQYIPSYMWPDHVNNLHIILLGKVILTWGFQFLIDFCI